MKIGVDIRTAAAPVNGKGVYTLNLMRELLRLDLQNQYILYTDRLTGAMADFSNAEIRIIHAHPLLWHFRVIKDATKRGLTAFFSPTSFLIPSFLPEKIISIITVHDLVAFLHPAAHQTKATVMEWLFFRRTVRGATRVLTPSEHTKKDLMGMFGTPERKIAVTPLGVREMGHSSGATLKLDQRENFILTVSGLEPRKNVAGLLSALEMLRRDAPKNRGAAIPPLIIVGGKGWKSRRAQRMIRAAGTNVKHIEKVTPEELQKLYRTAKLFVYPSFYEGFGLPPLEAMANGCPVVCSNATSLPEVCGDGALYFDPKNTEEMARTIATMLNDETLRKTMAEKGLHRAAEFTWKRTAEKTLAVLNSIQL